jgi:hypothetical protein
MARLIQQLTEAKIRTLAKVGLHMMAAVCVCRSGRVEHDPGFTDTG